jgi:pSer/pThr/pTyr-binding forkhead associated (FHA) protein
LVAKSGKLKGRSYTLGARLVIGRARGCDIVVTAEGTSRKHAIVLSREDGSVVLRDLASRNGTLVDAHPIRHALLKPGAQFTVGDSTFELRVLEMGEHEPVVPVPQSARGMSTEASDRTTSDEGGSPDRRRELLALAKSLRDKKSR